MTPEEIKILKNVPLEKLRHYLEVRDKKSYYVKKQMWAEAAELRDKEREFVNEIYEIFGKINESALLLITVENLRELVIDEIVN